MKKAVFIIMSLFIFAEGASSQNKISNHSFEERNPSASNNRPDEEGGIQKEWCNNWIGGGDATADWFLDEPPAFFGVSEEIGGIGGERVFINAPDGIGFTGILSQEMIQTEISNLGENPQRQLLKFKIRISDKALFLETTTLSGLYGTQLFSGTTTNLNIYASTEMMSYDNQFWCDGDNESDYGSNAKLVAQVPVSLDLYATGMWHQIEVGFAPPINTQWIGIENMHPTGCYPVLIDDVILEDAFNSCSDCLLSCDPLDGCIQPTFLDVGTAHNQNVPLSFGGLSNISDFKLSIYPQDNINQILRSIEIKNPYAIVSWDGKNHLGDELPAANYTYVLELSNNCESKKFEDEFPKFNSGSDPTLYRTTVMDYLSVVKQDVANDECCYDTILISNDVLDFIAPPMNLSEVGGENTLIGTFNIVAVSTIIIDDNVNFTTGSNITFQAKDTVDFIAANGEELAIEQGAEIEVIIDECMMMLQEPPPPLFSRISIQKAKVEKFELTVTPNPSNSIFEFQLPLSDSPVHLQIINLNGQIVHETVIGQDLQSYNIDLSEESHGIYIVKLREGENIFSKKIILN